MRISHVNLVFAWCWILLGFVSGLIQGLFFHKDDWLGGYCSFRRRLYRLAHISLFGLGAVNLMFFLTFRDTSATRMLEIASWSFVLGGISMPVCCLLMAHCRSARLLFGIPIAALLLGGVLAVLECL